MVKRLRRVNLLKHAALQHGNPVAHCERLGLIVCDIYCRHAELALQADDFRPHLHAQLGVEVGQRFVHQERRGLAHHCASHRNPLPLTAGQGRRLPVKQRLKLQSLGDFVDALCALRLALSRQLH